MAKQKAVDANGYPKFGMRDKLAYASGDIGCNMSFALKGTLLIFWTQFMGIEQNLYAFLLLIVQIWDAINDPVIGGLIDADKRKYKLGKFRTYILIGSIGLLIAGALCFIPWPGAPAMAKNILFIAGYILWDAFYTIANVPYGSMLCLISDDPGDRAQLSSWRSLGSMVGNMVPMAVLPMIIYDADNNLIGERVFIAAFIMGIAGFIFFQFMIRNTVERVNVEITLKEETPKFNVITAIGNFLKNRPAMGATLAAVAMFVGMYGAQAANTAMWQSYFQNAKISGVISILTMVPMFVFMPFIRKIVSKWGTKEAATVGGAVSVIGCLALIIMPIGPNGAGIVMFVIGMLINGIGQGIYQCVSYSMMASAIDYNEWKFGVRDEGTTYAMHSFFRKLAQGVGPSLGLVVAGWLGYNAALGPDQTFEVASNMRYMVAGAYLLGAALNLIAIGGIYNLNKETVATMNKDLNERRAAGK